MELQEYRKNRGLTYKGLAKVLNMSENKVYRICNDANGCLKLVDAHKIITVTSGMVMLEDLLPVEGDC